MLFSIHSIFHMHLKINSFQRSTVTFGWGKAIFNGNPVRIQRFRCQSHHDLQFTAFFYRGTSRANAHEYLPCTPVILLVHTYFITTRLHNTTEIGLSILAGVYVGYPASLIAVQISFHTLCSSSALMLQQNWKSPEIIWTDVVRPMDAVGSLGNFCRPLTQTHAFAGHTRKSKLQFFSLNCLYRFFCRLI